MRYTKRQFDAEYPDDDSCLDTVFKNRYGDMKVCPKCKTTGAKFYRVRNRQCYACEWCSYQIFPLADTIFRKTRTPLKDWFYAIYLFSTHRNGVSAATLQQELGVTYKTAWRMCNLIRQLMSEDVTLGKSDPVEVDEFQSGRRKKLNHGMYDRTLAFGAAERNGKIKMETTDWVSTNRAMSFVRAHIETGAELYTDGSRVYNWTNKEYRHTAVNHSKKVWTKGNAHVNTIEGLWGYIESAITGTYRGVSPKYLQYYLDEYTFRYNHKHEAICQLLLAKAGMPF